MYTAGACTKVKQQKDYSWEVDARVQRQTKSGYISMRTHPHRADYCHRLQLRDRRALRDPKSKRCYNNEERKGSWSQFMCIWQRDSSPKCKDLYLTTYGRIHSSQLICYTQVHSPYRKFLVQYIFQNFNIFVFYKDNSVHVLSYIECNTSKRFRASTL